MASDTTVVHVTHEATGKIGGIGAVLEGFFTCNSYINVIGRSILISPLFSTEGPPSKRLGEDGQVLYSSLDGLAKTKYAGAFRNIENFFGVGIVYGKRSFTDCCTGLQSSSEVEVLLFDVRGAYKCHVDELKRQLYERFGVQSNLYEHIWEYEQYVRQAPAAIATLKAIGATNGSTTIISHEFMGMPTALAAIADTGSDFKTAFYAHEVATMRRIAETYPGHDTMFYNAMEYAHKNNLHIEQLFGNQDDYFKHPLIKAAKYCDNIYAVGDYVAEELKFLDPEFKNVKTYIVYNGIPAQQISVDDKLLSKEKLQRYCENLLGYKPDFVFTHVTRLVESKGLWRDLEVLYRLEELFRAIGKKGVFFLLSTEVAERYSRDIYRMESEYNWPVAHREGWPDLSGGEARFYTKLQKFNADTCNIKAVFINQFGFNRISCGEKMPEDMEFMDIRKGSDVEFGQSIYEPFGIAPLEPLTYGGICVVSNVCGCAGFVRAVANGQDTNNVIVADYTNLNNGQITDVKSLLKIEQSLRYEVEHRESRKVAEQIIERLPKNKSEIKSMLERGFELANKMSWETVVNYLWASLEKTLKQPRKEYIGIGG